MKQMIYMSIIFTSIFLIPNAGWSHGEETPGPHGGFIRMPGALHTEVLPINDRSIAIYLLDIHFNDPTVIDSSVEVVLRSGESRWPLSCEPKDIRFECTLPDDVKLSVGELFVKSTRKGVQGVEIKYPVPLRHEKSAKAH